MNLKVCLHPCTWVLPTLSFLQAAPSPEPQKKGHENDPKYLWEAWPKKKHSGQLPERWSRDHNLPRTILSELLFVTLLARQGQWRRNPALCVSEGSASLSLLPWSQNSVLCQKAKGEVETGQASICGDTRWQLPLQGTGSLRKSARYPSLGSTSHRLRKHRSSCLCQLPFFLFSQLTRMDGGGVGGVEWWWGGDTRMEAARASDPKGLSPFLPQQLLLHAYLVHRSRPLQDRSRCTVIIPEGSCRAGALHLPLNLQLRLSGAGPGSWHPFGCLLRTDVCSTQSQLPRHDLDYSMWNINNFFKGIQEEQLWN